ncbi:lysylphosphatidylglycerol synthase transmembrane domain-containing protein [Candidatus Halobeggiatoa sp. HSG11]|nr:lysylphosphatidylglycerol synthase transmembrane domain-containing protein [Candidatus Halobeggiatoa sp. HSG11]
MNTKKIRYGIGILLIGITVWFLSTQPEVLTSLQQIAWYDLVGLILLSMLIILILGVQFKYLILIFGLNLPFREWLGLTAVNTMCNYYLPVRGGLIVRGAYLKRQYNFPFSRYTSLVIVSQLLMLGVAAILGIIFLVGSLDIFAENTLPLLGLYVSVIIITLSTYKIMPSLARQSARFNKLRPFLQQFMEGLKSWQQHRFASVYFSLLMAILIFLWGLRLYICFMAVGESVSFGQIMIIQTILSFSLIISITPGNLGIKEGITAFSANLLGISPTAALLASLVERAVVILVVFGMGLIFSHILMRELKS